MTDNALELTAVVTIDYDAVRELMIAELGELAYEIQRRDFLATVERHHLDMRTDTSWYSVMQGDWNNDIPVGCVLVDIGYPEDLVTEGILHAARHKGGGKGNQLAAALLGALAGDDDPTAIGGVDPDFDDPTIH